MTQSLKTALTMLVLGLLLLVAVLVGWRQLTEPLPTSQPEQTGPCTDTRIDAGAEVRPEMVTVSVYNAGTRSGLADRTMDELVARGFNAGETGNLDLPANRGVPRAQVWVQAKGDGIARLVASHLGRKPAPVVQQKKVQGVGVMVVVGDQFTNVVDGLPSVRAMKATTICSPTGELG